MSETFICDCKEFQAIGSGHCRHTRPDSTAPKCNCKPKLDKLSIYLPLMTFKIREHIEIPRACPIHKTSPFWIRWSGRNSVRKQPEQQMIIEKRAAMNGRHL
jgi:hypothetical protein